MNSNSTTHNHSINTDQETAAPLRFAAVSRLVMLGVGRHNSHKEQYYMPTVLRSGPYRFFFYASDHDEPVHIHVERDEKVAKYWLDPARFKTVADSIALN